jgi:ribonuclease VapC
VIVVHASALVAIAELEPEAAGFAGAIHAADPAVISPVNAAEAGFVLLGRGRFADPADFQTWLEVLEITVWRKPIDEMNVLAAFWRYGKGRHPARLNLGDCFAYTLAKKLDAPLLYKGDAFARTDVRSAL